MYHALYRKYRPKDFDSVVGQDSIVKTLRNSIKNQTFSHAYLFYGPRGTGKTTVSKIFARDVNCLDFKEEVACGKCSACKVSFSNDCVDIIEIDAASNNGVDEIRDLKSKVTLVPSELKYKVYIIDEVHMLSIGAFNALLKTLEEPPDHAIFILATTDFQKVPTTIVSRCQCFAFKRISDKAIVDRLKYVCSEEKIEIDNEVLEKISILSDGGLRDALGFLDKLVSYTDDKITINDFNDLNGIISDEEIASFISNIFAGNIPSVLSSLDEYNNSGKNLIQILVQVINFIRNYVVDFYVNKAEEKYSIPISIKFLNLINEKMFDIKRSSNPKIYIEIFILKFINDNITSSNSSSVSQTVSKNVEKIDNHANIVGKNVSVEKSNLNSMSKDVDENNLTNASIYDKKDMSKDVEEIGKNDRNVVKSEPVEKSFVENSRSDSPRVLNYSDIMKARVNNTFVSASKDILKHEAKNFEALRDYSFSQSIGYIVCAILDGKLRLAGNDSIVISYEYDSNVTYNLSILDKITDVYNKISKSNKKIAIISDSDWDKYKNEYITNLKNGTKYNLIDEPKVIFEDVEKDDIINSSNAMDLFGDIVEVD